MRIGLGIGLDFAKKRGNLVAPVATAATSVGQTSFVANWNTYDGATTYYLDVSTSSTFATFVLQNQAVSAPTTNYTVTGLTACTTYYYRVRAEGVVPTISVAPTLSPSGTQLTGAVITCGTGTWSSQGAIFNYRWKRNGVAITGSTSSTYTIQAIDAGTTITCDVQNQNGFGKSAYVGTSNSVSAVAVDPDAQAFITAAGITDATQQQAINTLVVDMKGYGIWTKMKAIYPFVGGTASTHKWNLKDPRDLNAAYRLVFNGGWTHSSTGATPNGTNGYFNTYLTPSVNLTNDKGGFSFYQRSNIDALYLYGVASGGFTNGFHIFPRYGNIMYIYNQNVGILDVQISSADSSGFIGITRDGSNVISQIRNSQTTTSRASTTSLPNLNFFGGALNDNGFPNYYSSNPLSAFLIHDSINATDMTNLKNVINSFQTTLGRNV